MNTHQGGIQNNARDQDEYHPNTKNRHKQIYMKQANMAAAYRKHIGEQYMTKAIPEMNDYKWIGLQQNRQSKTCVIKLQIAQKERMNH